MEPLISILVVIGIFVVLVIIMQRKWKNATLDKLELLAEEKVLFDDESAVVKLKASPRVDILPGSVIRVTDHRIIIAQKALGRKNTMIMKYVIDYTGAPPPEGMAGGALKTGYISYRTISQKLSIIEENGISILRIEPLREETGIPVWLHIESEDIERYRNALGLVS